ncbi:MAG: serine/threonine-protein kinase [Polyangiaceae bacterium]
MNPDPEPTISDDESTLAATPEAIDGRGVPTERPPPGVDGEPRSGSLDGSSSPSSSSSSSIFSTSVGTPLETMHIEEIGRTRIFVRYAMGLAVVVSVLGPFVGGDEIGKRFLYGGLALIIVCTSWLAWKLRDDAGYTIQRVLLAANGCMVGAFCGIWFFGVYSPAPIILPFGLYFFSAAQSFRATISVYLSCSIAYFLMCTLTWSGLAVDHGVLRGDSLGPADRAVVVLLVEATLLATFLAARNTRLATLRAIELHDKAVRGIAQREALLEEARQDLQAAMRAGGLGRFTDATLGSYRIGKLIGRGAMGEVYEGTHVSTNEPAAVKLLQAHVLADPELVRRFFREAKIAASLDVPNVVRVLEIGGAEAPFPYLAMERLTGEDLADHLRRHRRLALPRVVQLVRDIGRGLDAARLAGIVHRDLKPRNIFLSEVRDAAPAVGAARSASDPGEAKGASPRRTWKILDFGVSKLMDSEGTQTKDQIIGTPAYMAPEQASGGEVSHSTDLYALGVIAYRALTGRPAFTGDHTAETLYQVVYQMPPRPSEAARLPPDLDLVLMIAMAKRPQERFGTAAELADALEAASRGALTAELRARAERLAMKQPWGTTGTRAASGDRLP